MIDGRSASHHANLRGKLQRNSQNHDGSDLRSNVVIALDSGAEMGVITYTA